MICRMTGRLEAVGEVAIVLAVGPVAHEILVPTSTLQSLGGALGSEITLHTLQYMEGNAAVSNFIPRTIGFFSPLDRDFFQTMTTVKGMGMKKTLRSLALPAQQIASAIERGDERLLTSLPEIGKKMANQIIVELRGRLARFTVAEVEKLHDAAARVDDAWRASHSTFSCNGAIDGGRWSCWVAVALEAEPGLAELDAIVRAAYRAKQRG